MALNLAELIIIGFIVDWLFKKVKIPGLVGILLTGVVMGKYVLNVFEPSFIAISHDLMTISMVVILLRAGFELTKETLFKVGSRSFLIAVIPPGLETLVVTFLGHSLLKISYMEAGILGVILSAVSPAVVVPMMIDFMDRGMGEKKKIPALVLTASTINDVIVLVLYGIMIGIYTGEKVNIAWKLLGIPISIITGILLGAVLGVGLFYVFKKFNVRGTKKLLVIISISLLLINSEHFIASLVPFASILSVIMVGFFILEKSSIMAKEISLKLSKLWVFAEIVQFSLVGAQVDLYVALKAGLVGGGVILLSLIARSIGTYLCLYGTDLNESEKLFVIVSYMPKATIQATIGIAPLLAMKSLGMNTQPGEIILAVAVLSILITAPMGAWLTSIVGERFLSVNS